MTFGQGDTIGCIRREGNYQAMFLRYIADKGYFVFLVSCQLIGLR